LKSKGKARPQVIVTIEELRQLLATSGTLAGIDLGDKTIGLAVSDRSLAFAHPRPVILRKKFSADAAALLRAVGKEDVRAVAIGLPVNMDGSEGPRAQASRAFVRNIARLSDLPFLFWDERLSTVAAERALIEMDVSRKKREMRIDSAAAAFILQGVLDRLQALGSSD
jgi:putative Holliday junction resolvase